VSTISPQDQDVIVVKDTEATGQERDESFWLGLASANFDTGKSYQDSSLTSQWEKNADHFNSKHYRRSAYNSKLYQGRSRLFRPLTRAAERSGAAQFATAFFSNEDIVSVKPQNESDPEQVAAARMMKQLLQYRLEKTIPWYLTCMGAWQDTRVYGPCVTYTVWDYQERVKDIGDGLQEVTIVSDKPVIEMVPPEGLLLDPACDWRDPINTSPYVIRLVPMYIVDVEAKMDSKDPKTGKPEWRKLSRAQLLSSQSDRYNTVRQAREGDNRPDKMDSQDRIEFQIVWMHENFVRMDGQEWVYWTAGAEHLVTEIKPLKDVYLHGQRPLTYGFSIIEAHRFAPSSATELISNLQAGVNDIANLRIDNIRLALNKRYIIRRGATIDLEALMMSVPGGGIFTQDPERDVKVLETRDVTASSYKEQERMETESNDISGTFMGSAVQNNRSLNKTVGGMEMLAEGSNAISELDIRTFSETWAKPQLELLMAYIRAYETDEVIFAQAFEEAKKLGGFEVPNKMEATDYKEKLIERIRKDKLILKVNVGLGATSPTRKSETLNRTLSVIAQVEEQRAKIDWDEVTKEQFAIAGFQDGKRFLLSENDEKEITEEDLQQAHEQGIEAAKDQAKIAEVESRERIAGSKLELERELGYAKLALTENITVAQLQAKLQVEASKDATRRDSAAAQAQSNTNELDFKRTTGKPGI